MNAEPAQSFDVDGMNRAELEAEVERLRIDCDALREALDNRQDEVERLQRHVDFAFEDCCDGNAHAARQHLTDARWGKP